MNSLTAQELAQWYHHQEYGRDFVVVDVRDADREGGHLRGSLHVPSGTFLVQLPELWKRYQHVTKFVFHCMHSQVRGPSCARKFSQYLLQEGGTTTTGTSPPVPPHVFILEGGFHRSQAVLATLAPELLEEYEAQRWADGWFDD